MTNTDSLADNIKTTPPVFDRNAARHLRDALGSEFTAMSPDAKALIDGVASCSPHLRRLARSDQARFISILSAPPEASLQKAIEMARGAASGDAALQMQILRQAKAQAALTIALADIAGVWDVVEATNALSRFADAAVEGALQAALAETPLESTAGYAVVAMGKHGAHELNYSSDIDLIVVFDRGAMGFESGAEAQIFAVKLTRALVHHLQTQTSDGYVFRTDLRLRPDPGVSAVAISVQAAETYYEAYGQNWERMAYIKARPCAGDISLGEKFLTALRPFIWRKYLDFAAIEDVHAVKRQIHTVKGGGKIEFEGHDIKLGRGGIREIEFYVQTQQLILGGKNPALRARGTLDALLALCVFGHISQRARDELTTAYRYLRHVEHRIQMVNDEQTHRVPREQDEIERLSIFAGEESAGLFRLKLETVMQSVQRCYAALFEAGDDPQSGVGPLVFTGVEDHPATLETLAGLGFSRGSDVSAAIRRWHTGAMRATRTERARVLLTKLVPPMLTALSKAGAPDDAFFAFESFLLRLPSGVQIFSLFLNNLEVFDDLIRIMTISPYLGRELSRRFNFIERLIDNEWSAPPPEPATREAACAKAAADAPDYEQALNAVRRWAGEQKFQIAAQLAVDLLPPDEASRNLTAIADACIRALTPAAHEEMQRQHGDIDGEMAVVALGRLGAGEMSVTSDIDLMFIYDAPPEAMSDGARPLGPVEYYTRLVRRLVTALSAATEEGALYDVDMQLRPSGGAGPAAVSLSAFRRYYSEDAWTWEVMALTKARAINPATELNQSITAEIDAVLRRQRAPATVAADVAEMRRRLLEAKPAANVWDVKHVRGGQTDLAFICQYLTLVTAGRLGAPPRHPGKAFAWFAKHGELAQEVAVQLEKAHSVFESLLQVSRAATGGVFAPENAGNDLCHRMAAICGAETIGRAEQALTKLQFGVAQGFEQIIVRRAEAGAGAQQDS